MPVIEQLKKAESYLIYVQSCLKLEMQEWERKEHKLIEKDTIEKIAYLKDYIGNHSSEGFVF